MKKFILALRVLLGVLLVIFGANKFLNFMPALEMANPSAGTLMGALANSYIMPLVGLVEIVAGLLLVIGKAIPFALLILVPISVNIVFFHATLDIANIAPAIVVAGLNAFLIVKNWSSYKNLF